jgi:hypothetical protein
MASRAREFENMEFVENKSIDEDEDMERNVEPTNNDEENYINEDWLNNIYEHCNCKIQSYSLFHLSHVN